MYLIRLVIVIVVVVVAAVVVVDVVPLWLWPFGISYEYGTCISDHITDNDPLPKGKIAHSTNTKYLIWRVCQCILTMEVFGRRYLLKSTSCCDFLVMVF